jgi:sensor histidine kinase YesM
MQIVYHHFFLIENAIQNNSIVAVLEHDLIVLIIATDKFLFFTQFNYLSLEVTKAFLTKKAWDQVALTMKMFIMEDYDYLSVFGKCYFQTYSKSNVSFCKKIWQENSWLTSWLI